MIGVNDAVKNLDIEKSAENIRSIMARLASSGIESHRFAILPVAGRFAAQGANEQIAALNSKVGPEAIQIPLDVDDVSYDGIHLTASAYSKIVGQIDCR